MELEISPGLKKKLRALSSHNFMHVWYRHYRLIFFILFLCTMGLAGYFWYYSLRGYQWSEAQKKAYVDQYFRETRFKEKEYQALIERFHAEEKKHLLGRPILRDIFTGQNLP